MKVNSLENLNRVIKYKEKEIEIQGEINQKVLKCCLVSNVVFWGILIMIFCCAIAVCSLVFWLISGLYFLMATGIVSICGVIFALTLIFTIKGIQKIPLLLTIKLRKYKAEKKNNKIVLTIKQKTPRL